VNHKERRLAALPHRPRDGAGREHPGPLLRGRGRSASAAPGARGRPARDGFGI